MAGLTMPSARDNLLISSAASNDKPHTITATARKLAILVYHALKGELVYRDPGADHYNAQQRSRALRRLQQRAATLGFELVNRTTGEVTLRLQAPDFGLAEEHSSRLLRSRLRQGFRLR